MHTEKRSLDNLQQRGLTKTGLKPIFPTQVNCPKIASNFADQTRYDGSARPKRRNFGYHGGVDISLPMNTPIVAIADGKIIQLVEGGIMVGIQIVLQHFPTDAGFDLWTYTKYKHLNKMPNKEIGQRVKMGEIIGYSGNTGTVGRHFGDKGYPHLHFSVYASESNKYKVTPGRPRFKIKNRQRLDPLAIYFRKHLNSNIIKGLPAKDKNVHIPYKLISGQIIPQSTKVIWPVMCEK